MTDRRQKWLSLAALLSVGLLVGDRLVLGPLAAHWGGQADRIRELRESLDRGASLLEREPALRDRWAEMQEEALPRDPSDAETLVLRATARWARDSRVLLTGLTPQWRRYKGNYQALECRLSAEGDLAALAAFLQALETDPLAVRLEACELLPADENGRRLTLAARFSALLLPAPEGPRP